MALIRRLQNSFVAGQIDKTMAMRSDMTSYGHGCETITNFRPLLLGGLSRRPGTQYLADLGVDGFLGRFIFNESQQYILFFNAEDLDIYTSAGALAQNLTTPYAAGDLDEVRYSQSGDTMIITHPDHAPRKVVRTGATSFTIATLEFEENSAGFPKYQPYNKYADTTVTLAASGTSGTGVTLTASSAVFASGHNGTIIRYKSKECLVTGFTDTTHVTVTVRETLPSTTATEDWDEQAFSAVRGYPRTVRFHDNRLVFGGSRDLPDTIFASKIGAFFNFDLGTTLDDEAIQASIGTDQVAEIRHLVSAQNLQIFTDREEFFIPTSDTKPFVPDNVAFRRQSNFGTGNVPPIRMEGATMYFDRSGQHLREFLFSDVEQQFSSTSMTKLIPTLLSTPVSMIGVPHSTDHEEQYVYVCNTDGTLALLHTLRSEGVTAWGKWTTTGTFESITSIEDDVFVMVKRTINSATKYYLEKLRFDWTLDCAKNLTASETTSWSGLGHLEGATVQVVASTFHEGSYTVSSSAITTSSGQTNIIVGLDYTPEIKDMPFEATFANGTVANKMKRITRLTIHVIDSHTWDVNGYTQPIYEVTDDISSDPPTRNGRFEYRLRGYDRLAQVTIGQSAPLPLTILGIEKEVRI